MSGDDSTRSAGEGGDLPPDQHRSKVKNAVATSLFAASFVLAMIPLIWLIFTVVSKGIAAIVNSTWWTNSLAGVLPEEFAGGVYHAIYGTLIQAAIAAAISVPLGVMAAVYLAEYGGGRLAKVTTFVVDILAGVPSIGRALCLRAVDRDPALEQSVFAVAGAVADAAGHPQHRGDARARS